MQVELIDHWNQLLAALPAVEQDVYFKEEEYILALTAH